jgi:peptide/nickel transport system substrate-binding protein
MICVVTAAWPLAATAAPEGQVTSAQVVAIAPRWFDPAEAEGIITPFIFYYALHDAVVKPMPGNPLTPSLAESWNTSADGLTYPPAWQQA